MMKIVILPLILDIFSLPFVLSVAAGSVMKDTKKWSRVIIIASAIFCQSILAQPFQHDFAMRKAQQGEWIDAHAELNKLLVENPDSADLLYDAGVAAHNLEKHSQACSYFAHAAERAQTIDLKKRALFNAGNACVACKQLEDALKMYDALLDLDSNDEYARHNRDIVAQMLEQQKQQQQDQEKQNQNKDDQQDKSEQDKKDNDQQQKNSSQKNDQQDKQQSSDQQKGDQQNKDQQQGDQNDNSQQQGDPQNGDQKNNDQQKNQDKSSDQSQNDKNGSDKQSDKKDGSDGSDSSENADQREQDRNDKQDGADNKNDNQGKSDQDLQKQPDTKKNDGKSQHGDQHDKSPQNKDAMRNDSSIASEDDKGQANAQAAVEEQAAQQGEQEMAQAVSDKINDPLLMRILQEQEAKDKATSKQLMELKIRQSGGRNGQNCW